MKYQAVIFDLDGVICHTDQYHYIAWKGIAGELNIEFDEKVNNRLRGVSRMESLEIILKRYHGEPLDDEQKLALATKKNDLYRTLLQQMSPDDLSYEVRTTLNALRDGLKLRLAIGSSSKNTPLILNKIGLGDFFDAVSDGNNITRSKPDPEVFLTAAKMLDVSPERCLVVEDAVAGVEAAKAGGMDVAALGDARQSKKADYSIHNFGELWSLLADS